MMRTTRKHVESAALHAAKMMGMDGTVAVHAGSNVNGVSWHVTFFDSGRSWTIRVGATAAESYRYLEGVALGAFAVTSRQG